MRRNVRKIGILATICSFCMILVCGVCSLFTNNTYKVSATTPTTGAHTVTEVCLHQGAISGNGFFCYFMENSTVLKQDLGTGLTEDNNTYLKNFANLQAAQKMKKKLFAQNMKQSLNQCLWNGRKETKKSANFGNK